MTHVTGTGTLVRLNLRKDRLWLAGWVIVLVGLLMGAIAAVDELYPTQADLDVYASTAGSSPAAVALNGPGHGIDTLGGAVIFEIGGYLAIAVALMSVFTVVRSTRAEEEAGRTELLRAGVLGRHATLAAAMIVVTGLNIVLGTFAAAGMIAMGLPAGGSLAFSASLAGVGVLFGAVAAVAAQVTEHSRGAYALAGVVVAAGYAIRAAGDAGGTGLSWASPFGWAQATRPFADERWWPLGLVLAVAVLLVVLAGLLERRRDVGAALIPQQPGPPSALAPLLTPVGFSYRLQRIGLIGWAVGVFALGVAFGSVGEEVEQMLASNTDLQEWVTAYGSSLTDAFFAMVLLILALVASGCAVSSALRAAQEESAGRAEQILATVISKPRWLLSHLVAPFIAAAVVAAAGGLGVGLAHGLRVGDLGEVPRMLAGSLVQVPAVWLLTGAAVLLFGLALRLTPVAWVLLAGCVVVSMFGALFQLPEWAMNLSPFEHTPRLPGGTVEAAPLLVLTAVSVALVVAGVAAFRRRDAY